MGFGATGAAVDFRALFESAPALCLVLDPQLRIVAVSDAYLKATMTVRAEIMGRDIFEVFPDNPDDPHATGVANLRASLERALHQRVPDTMAVQQYDVARPDAGGGGFEVRYWSPRNTPVIGADGRVAYLIHQVEDVTEFVLLQQQGDRAQQQTDQLRERTEQMQAEILRRSRELHEANQALRAASDAKNEFLSRVSHELRTPLNAILGFSELLTLGELDTEPREWAGLIFKAGRHLLALLNDVLDIARIEGGNLSMSVEPVPVDALINDALDLVRPLAEAGGVRVAPTRRLPEDLCVAADRQRLRQVLLNLLSNAIKYNHPGGSVAVIVEHRRGQWLRIRVMDTGRGIAPESLSKLFTRSNASTPPRPGSRAPDWVWRCRGTSSTAWAAPWTCPACPVKAARSGSTCRLPAQPPPAAATNRTPHCWPCAAIPARGGSSTSRTWWKTSAWSNRSSPAGPASPSSPPCSPASPWTSPANTDPTWSCSTCTSPTCQANTSSPSSAPNQPPATSPSSCSAPMPPSTTSTNSTPPAPPPT